MVFILPALWCHIWMWELDCEESWALKNWCFWTVMLEKTLESPLDCKEIQPVHPKGNEPWIFIGRTDAKLKLQYFGHLMQRPDSLEKTLMLGKIIITSGLKSITVLPLIQSSHPLSSPSPPALNLSRHQVLFKWVSSSHQVAKVLEFQLQHQSFQWISKVNFL